MIARLFLTLLIGLLSSLPYSLILTLLPAEMQTHGLNKLWYSPLIYYVYGFGWLVSSFFTVKCLFHYQGRLGSAVFGSIVVVNGMVMYLLSRFIHYTPLYLALSLLSRFIQGIGSGIAQTAFTSLITKKYVSMKGRMISMYLLGVLSGIKLGPFVGAYLEIKIGAVWMFALMAAITLLKALTFYLYQDIETSAKFQNYNNNIFSFHEIVFRAGPFFSFLNCYLACLSFLNIEPLLASNWHQLYCLSANTIGLRFFISALVLPILALFFSCFSQNHDRRILIIFGNIISGTSQFLLAPSIIFGMKQAPYHLDTGLILNTIGVALSFCFVFHESWRSAFKTSHNPYFYDIIAGIITIVIGGQMTMGPLYLSILSASAGFPATMDIIGLLKIGFSLVYGSYLLKEAIIEKKELLEGEILDEEEIGLIEES